MWNKLHLSNAQKYKNYYIKNTKIRTTRKSDWPDNALKRYPQNVESATEGHPEDPTKLK
jgi:hypothetical protein